MHVVGYKRLIYMREQFLPYEIAIILKEKGFDDDCFGYYNKLPNSKEFTLFGLNTTGNGSYRNTDLRNKKAYACAAPLPIQVAAWFREKHKLSIEPQSDWFAYSVQIIYNTLGDNTCKFKQGKFESYDEAFLTGIKKAIELI